MSPEYLLTAAFCLCIFSGHACTTVYNLHIWSSCITGELHLLTEISAYGPSHNKGNQSGNASCIPLSVLQKKLLC